MKKIVFCLLALIIVFSAVGCNSKDTGSEKEVSGTVSGAKFYRIGYPDLKNDAYAQKNFLFKHFDFENKDDPFGAGIQDFSNNGKSIAVDGYNIKGCNKAIIYAAYSEKDYFIFYDAAITSANKQNVLTEMLSSDYMPYSEGKKYIKKYMK